MDRFICVKICHNAELSHSLVITLLDALQGVNPVKLCVGYTYKGEKLKYWPLEPEIMDHCIPDYVEMPGWSPRTQEEWATIAKQGVDALPKEVKEYIAFIEKYLNTKINVVSVGPDRAHTIMVEDPWN